MEDRDTAIEHLRVIRSLMEKATVYRAVNVPTALAGGIIALITSGVIYYLDANARVLTEAEIVGIWLGALCFMTLFNHFLIWRTARKEGEPFVSSGFKMALKAILPPMFAGGVIGVSFGLYFHLGQAALAWATFYGLALMATSGFSPRSLRYLGLAFTLTGSILWGLFMIRGDFAFLNPIRWNAILMGLTFGCFHLVYGVAVYLVQRRQNGASRGSILNLSRPLVGMIDFNKLDKTIHEKARLSIMTLLATRVEWSFQDLKTELKMSDGNLISHLRILQQKEYVTMSKETDAGRPRTVCSLTTSGRKAFEEYLLILERIVNLGKDI